MNTRKFIRLVTVCVLAAIGTAVAQTPPMTGLQLWLKADAITNLNSGDKVSSWPDSSGSGYPAANADTTKQPKYVTNVINGKPAVLFSDNNGGNNPLNYLSSALPLNANSNDVTTLVVFMSNEAGARDHVLQPIGSGGSTWLWVQTNTLAGGTNLDLVGNFGGAPAILAHRQYLRGTWTIVSQVESVGAKTFNLYRDGVLEGGVSFTTSSAASSGWVLGANKALSNQGMNGYIAEVLIYAGALSDADRQTAEQYLAAKYGFTFRTTLLADTFNTSDTFDLGQDLNLRETGSLAPIAGTPSYYSTQDNLADSASITTNTLKLIRADTSAGGGVAVTPNLNFLSYELMDSFRVTFDLTTARLGATDDAWSSFGLRSLSTLTGPGGAGFNLLIRPGGIYDFFDGSTSLTNAAPTAGSGTYRVCLDVVNNILSATINGMPVQIAPGQYSYALTNANTTTGNYLTMRTLAFAGAAPAAAGFDNLVVSVPPDPSTVVLTDNYNTADTTNLNDNLAARQTGTVAPATYATAENNGSTIAIQGNQVKISNPDATNSVGIFWPEVDFLPCERFGSFRFSCTINPVSDNPATMDSWAGVKIREPNPVGGVLDANGLGILLRPGGGWQIFEGSTALGGGGVASAPAYNLVIESRTNVAKVTINGVTILSGHVMPASSNVAGISLISFCGTDGANPVPTGVSATFEDFKYEALGAAVSLPVPTLINPSYSNGTNSFQFGSVAQVAYAVQYKNDLADPSWVNLKNVLGTGGTVTVTDSTGGNARYYRVWLHN